MRLEDLDTNVQFPATVVSVERLTPQESPHDVREIVMDVSNRFDVLAGQNIGVLAPGGEFGQSHHFRLYSLADLPEPCGGERIRLQICVRRCSYIDAFNGEQYPGVASNYLCDLTAGDTVTITGPYGSPFTLPPEPEAALILIGAGTGIAPFRAFVKLIFQQEPGFQGRIHLFHGAHTGLDLLYMNDRRDDFSQYYDQETFEAISVLSSRPHWSDTIDWQHVMHSRSEELWGLLTDAKTYVYLAGLERIRDELDAAFAQLAGSPEEWQRRKAELTAGGRWIELLY